LVVAGTEQRSLSITYRPEHAAKPRPLPQDHTGCDKSRKGDQLYEEGQYWPEDSTAVNEDQ
jgi:hypothetical protein